MVVTGSVSSPPRPPSSARPISPMTAPQSPVTTETVLMPSGASICLPVPVPRADPMICYGDGRSADTKSESTDSGTVSGSSLQSFLQRLFFNFNFNR